jgi:hypothetical protein
MTVIAKSNEAERESSSSVSLVPLGFHPGEPRQVMTQYRKHILDCKRRWNTARGLIMYRRMIQTYLWAKRSALRR